MSAEASTDLAQARKGGCEQRLRDVPRAARHVPPAVEVLPRFWFPRKMKRDRTVPGFACKSVGGQTDGGRYPAEQAGK